MNTVSPALKEAFDSAQPSMVNKTTLEQLGGFSHSHCYKDRDFDLHSRVLGLSAEDFSDGDRLLVIGSGTTRRFERELSEIRPDVEIVSVDPLLRHGIPERLKESIRMGAFTDPGEEFGARFPRELSAGERYFRVGAVCGGIALGGGKRDKSNYLPFGDSTFQHVVGLNSLPQYCDADEVPGVMKEVLRVMDEGAIARFFPVFAVDESALLASGFQEHTSSFVLDGEQIYRWYWDGSEAGTKRLVFTK